MKISYNWLKSYVPDLPEALKLADVFTFHICEIESTDKLSNGDYVFDLKILPDRAHDLLCHRGVAKDLAGILGLEYKDLNYEVPKGEKTSLKIKIENDACRRYIGRIVRDVKVEKSSAWVEDHLAAVGQRPINNMVDAANIVMFDRGNPIHVFDLDKVRGGIVIRMAKEGEKITTLDNKEVKLSPLNLVIADDENVLAIAGIKGGKIAEVNENTKNIIIEVANFDPTSVRKTSKEVNIFTDAVKRYENDLSPEVAGMTMNDMTALVLEMCKGAKVEEVVDIYSKKQEQRMLTFSLEKVSKVLGLEISASDVENIFKNYKTEYTKDGDDFTIKVPVMRLDLNIEEDMAEEIGRVMGYDKIKAILPKIEWNPGTNEIFNNINNARNQLINEGYFEVMTYTFRDKGEVEVLASASDKKFLRNNLSDGLLDSVGFNSTLLPLLGIKNFKKLKIFEIGTIFKKDGEQINLAYNKEEKIIETSLNEFCKNMHSDFKLEPRSLNPEAKFKMWSLFPFIARDVAVWMPEGENPEKLKKILMKNGTELMIKEPYVFDSFTKDGKTSYAFRLVFQSYTRTLTDQEVNDIMTKITNKIKENDGWQVR